MNVIRSEEQLSAPQVLVDQQPAFGWIPQAVSFMRRRWSTLAIGAAICVALALAYVLTVAPTFSAETDLLIDIRRTDLLSQQHEIQDAQTLNAVLESQVEILRSEGLARLVVTRLDLVHDPQFNATRFSLTGWVRARMADLSRGVGTAAAAPDPQLAAAERFRQLTSVRRTGLTYVIEISVSSSTPEESARLANGLVDAYIEDQLAAKESTTKAASIWMQDRLYQLKDQATAADTIVQRYKAEKGIVDTDKGLMNEQQLAELNSQIVAARARTSEMRARLDRITAIMEQKLLDATVADSLQNSVINSLRQKYLDDAQQEAAWTTKYGPDHNAVVKLRAEMVEIQRAIRNELGRIAESYKSDYAVARADQLAVEARMNELVSLTAKTNGDRVALRSLQSSADTYRSVYENFLTRYTQAVQDESFPISEARVITAARPPLRKSWPRSNLVLGGAGVVGLSLGFMVALLREATDHGIRTAGQLRTVTGLQCIGLLPALGRRRHRRGTLPGAAVADAAGRIFSRRSGMLRRVLEQPKSPFAEGIRALRVRLCRGHPRVTPANLIGCVSACRGEGTSTVAANLAQALSQAGYRTLLVDWDYGPGSLSHALAPSAKAGFLDLLAGSAKLDELVWSDPETGLHFLPAGARASRITTGLIAAPRAQEMRTGLQARYHYVIVDIPALSPVVEAHAATHLLDAFLLVVAWGRADPDVTVSALTDAELDDRRFVGAVLNRVDVRALRRYPRTRADRAMAALA